MWLVSKWSCHLVFSLVLSFPLVKSEEWRVKSEEVRFSKKISGGDEGIRLSRELRAQSVAALTIINRHSLPLPFESHRRKNQKLNTRFIFWFLVEMKGFEPLTPCLQGRCSPSWATPPWVGSLDLLRISEEGKPFLGVSIELSSRTVARKVFSPLQSLTSVFGMGTGGPSAFVTLTFSLIQRTFPCSLKIEQQI